MLPDKTKLPQKQEDMSLIDAEQPEIPPDDEELYRLMPENEEPPHESENRYRVLAETAPDAIITIDEDSTILFVNPAGERIFGYTLAEIQGSSLAMLMPYSMQSAHRAGMRRYLETEQRHISWSGVELPGLHKDGREIPLEVSFGEFTSGGKRFFTGIIRAISTRKRAEEELRVLESAVRQASDAVVITSAELDPPGPEIIFINPAFTNMTGYTPEDVKGKTPRILQGPKTDRAVLDRVRRSLSNGQSISEETINYRKDGTEYYVAWRIAPVRDSESKITHFVAVQRNVTEQKRAAAALLERTRMASLGADVGKALTRGGSLQESLQRCAEALIEHLDAAFVRIWTFNVEENVLELRASAGLYTHTDGAHSRVPFGEFKIGRIAAERKPHLTNDVINDPHVSDPDWARREGMIAFAGYPLIVEDRLVGVMAKFARQPLTEDCLRALESVADGIALGIERKRAEEELHIAHEGLERRVEQRTFELVTANALLKDEIAGRKRAEHERAHLLQRLITAQEEERHRIARELHDQTGQYLAALMMGLKSLDGSSTSPSPESVARLQELTAQFSRDMRHFALELRPTSLDDLGLHTALQNHVDEWSERYGIAVDVHSNGLIKQRLPPHVETALYRVVQEALTNVLKHAKAERVSLVLEYRGGRVLAVLEDDGRGFDVEAALRTPVAERGLGLTGMRERVEAVGGTLEIESSPGTGTTLVVRVPVTPHEEKASGLSTTAA